MKDKDKDKKVNVSSVHKAGRKTQIMLDKYGDIAKLANNKLVDSHRDPEHQKAILKEIVEDIDAVLSKSDKLAMGKHLQKYFKRLERISDELEIYIEANFE